MEFINVPKAASRGIVIAEAYKYLAPDLTPVEHVLLQNEIDDEIELFVKVKNLVVEELGVLAEKNEIFDAHLEIANDFTLHEGIISKIKSQNKNAQHAVDETINEIAMMFSMVDDPYMQERSADVKDVGKRFIAHLKGVDLPDLGVITKEVIVVAKDLYPSDTVKINTDFVKGIITQEGGVTSHVCIIAKSMDIPILVGVEGVLDKVQTGTVVCMDAQKGDIFIEPDQVTVQEFTQKREEYLSRKEKLKSMRSKKVVKDGKTISLCANVGNVADIQKALEMNIDGVGLFRSELLYMESSHFPTEEEQFKEYKKAVELIPEELTIRTLDIGGDKELSYFEFDKEENPFLGWRAVRICLEMEDMFKEQLRAILRASAFGNVRIMIPMVISIEEMQRTKELIEVCKTELENEGIDFNKDVKVGMMIETPSSVLLADEFASIVDFFSIGTNDLTQYLLAVDRGNKKVANMYNYMHPAVLKAIKYVIETGHKHNIPVGMCGEMAGDVVASKILLEMGLDEFSMSATSIDYVKEVLLNEIDN